MSSPRSARPEEAGQATPMRIRSIITIAAVAATALIAPAGAANAATTDANGVVTVSKGEIMAQFPGMNEKAFQTIAMADGQSLTGSNVFTATTTTGVGCSDGTVQHHFRNTILTSPITLTEIYNGSADKVTGWTSVPRARASSPRPTPTAPRRRAASRTTPPSVPITAP